MENIEEDFTVLEKEAYPKELALLPLKDVVIYLE